jgi:hypothetical protein
MEEERQEQMKRMAKVIAKAWSDESFKERLLSDPSAVLEAEGISVRKGAEVKVVEETEKLSYFVIPMLPDNVKDLDTMEQQAAASMVICY